MAAAAPLIAGPRVEGTRARRRATNRVTTFGGLVGGVPDQRTLTLTEGNGTSALLWVDLTPSNDLPAPRSLHSAVQANVHRMVVFGGAGASGRLADVWVLEETQSHVLSVPPDPIVPASQCGRTRIRLGWSDRRGRPGAGRALLPGLRERGAEGGAQVRAGAVKRGGPKFEARAW